MAKVEDIEMKIDQLDGGSFQNLCDAYLSRLGYKNILSLGMKIGTQKTTIGNPDTYFITPSGKYVFVMYTTQKTGFIAKAIEDIDKCLNPVITGVQPDDVAEIIYCHTYDRLSAGEDKYLKDYCVSKNVLLTLKGLDTIAMDLYLYHHVIAKDYLGVTLDTGQIFDAESFIRVHDTNKLSAPLNTEFLFREKEIEESIKLLNNNDILVISGSAGVGKTRLALKICTDYSLQNGYKFMCIKSNHLNIFDDLRDTLGNTGQYILLIDDANELTGLSNVLYFLNKKNEEFLLKIVITVRSYARSSIWNEVSQYRAQRLLLSTFKDDEIRKLLEQSYGITNQTYTDRIIIIAEGNARLAMLAGKLCIETNKLDSIKDASELYDSYYSKQIQNILSGSKSCIITAGVIAFLKAIHLSILDKHPEIFTAVGITKAQFIEDIRDLHSLELIDIYNEKAVKISDQTFANFLLKYVYVEHRYISLSSMIETCFSYNRPQTILACNTLLNVFLQPELHEYIGQEINTVWNNLEHDKARFEPFFKAFHMVRPTETLIEMKRRIEDKEVCVFDVMGIDFEKEKNNMGVRDEIIEILGNFSLHGQMQEAIELLLLYYKKRPDLFMQIYHVLTNGYGIDKDSHRYGYVVQKMVVNQLISYIGKEASIENMLLFVRVADYLLQLHFSPAIAGRNDTIIIYQIPLVYSTEAREYREIIWKKLCEIYKSGYLSKQIEDVLIGYGDKYNEAIDYSIIKDEFHLIEVFFQVLLSPDKLAHCAIAEHIKKIADRAGITNYEKLYAYLNAPNYVVYRALCEDYIDRDDIDIVRADELRKEAISELISHYTVEDVDLLMRICKESDGLISHDEYSFSCGIQIAFIELGNYPSLFFHAIHSYINNDTPCNIHPGSIIKRLFELMTPEAVYELIDSTNYSAKNIWHWEFYSLLPEECITEEYVARLYEFFSKPSSELKRSGFRPLNMLDKYQKCDQRVWINASRIILNHYGDNPFIFYLYFDLMLNSHHISADEFILKYEDDISLLCEIYIKCITYDEKHTDYNGEFLMHLLTPKSDFLYEYLDTMQECQKSYEILSEESVRRLHKLWCNDNYIEIFDSIISHLFMKHSDKKWTLASVLQNLLLNQKEDGLTLGNQNEWIKHVINLHYEDEDYMYIVFSALSELPVERRKDAVIQFVENNPNPDIFMKLPLEEPGWGGMGSMIPYMEERISYLSSLLPIFTGIRYIQHKQRIESDIKIWRDRIADEEIKEVLRN